MTSHSSQLVYSHERIEQPNNKILSMEFEAEANATIPML